jgi:hypothetical protein
MARRIPTTQQQAESGTRGDLPSHNTKEEVGGPGYPRNRTQAQGDLGKAWHGIKCTSRKP